VITFSTNLLKIETEVNGQWLFRMLLGFLPVGDLWIACNTMIIACCCCWCLSLFYTLSVFCMIIWIHIIHVFGFINFYFYFMFLFCFIFVPLFIKKLTTFQVIFKSFMWHFKNQPILNTIRLRNFIIWIYGSIYNTLHSIIFFYLSDNDKYFFPDVWSFSILTQLHINLCTKQSILSHAFVTIWIKTGQVRKKDK
jgi:hypothetical protein